MVIVHSVNYFVQKLNSLQLIGQC
ncbi:hypothetical protein Goklo_013406 [Gossypium klotzschianum]|uniref:Uncharacterized protein n=1 Tax=Gossypium klotzschianum TaxID=34286 RepID=A0A7J8U493_9ROSI|nr:hypothetical protein [Gossypium klotzschianum]